MVLTASEITDPEQLKRLSEVLGVSKEEGGKGKEEESENNNNSYASV